MKLEDQVCSLELAKEMKALGFPQEGSLFYWCEFPESKKWELFYYLTVIEEKVNAQFLAGFRKVKDPYKIAAPTAGELGEMLPEMYYSVLLKKDIYPDMKWAVISPYGKIIIGYPDFCDTEANARAKMLIYLKKNNLLPEERRAE